MASAILVGIAALALWYFGAMFAGYRKNIKNAKASGFEYVILPVNPYNIAWILLGQKLLPLFEKWLPEKWTRAWLPLTDTDWIWNSLRKPLDELGTEAILLVSSVHNVLFVSDASVIHQITSSRERFPKPTEDYEVLNTFGRNIITTEGPEWRRHRKAMAPGFNESNNRLVFHETIMQAEGMVRHWMRGGSESSSKTIKSLPDDTMRITLYIITAIGFGVRLLWPGETSKESDGSGLITFPDEPTGEHTMSFQASLKLVLEEAFLIVLIPLKILKHGTKRMRAAYESYINWKAYTEELLEKKAAQARIGEKVEGMDLMRLLIENTSDPVILAQTSSPSKLEPGKAEKPGTDLTRSEILGDTFITVLAGHETTANTIHFMLVHLAMSPTSQRHLQADVDKTFSNTSPDEWDYDTAITTLLGNMVGATFNEMLRLMPPVVAPPKKATDDMDQTLTMDGETKIVHKATRINLNAIGAQRSPRYWPSTGPSKISSKSDDLDDFVPERWLNGAGGHNGAENGKIEDMQDVDKEFGGFTGTDTSNMLFKPVPGSYLPFSDGQRSCLGRRLAQVEMVTVMSVVFQKFSVELAVDEWASDEEVAEMGEEERRRVYAMAMERARRTVRTASTMLTLKLHGAEGGDTFVPVTIVRRGEERFVNLFT